MTYVAREPGRDVREAELAYETVDRRGGLSLVRIRLHTGRTHQIRVQFASRGLPLLGDGKYGLPGDPGPIALWSWRLRFTHPETGREMTFTHQPPPVAPWSGFQLPLAGR